MLHVRNKGKITIHLEKDQGKLNSKMVCQGIAKKADVALTTLLINFASFSQKNGKDPKELIDKHLPDIMKMIEKE